MYPDPGHWRPPRGSDGLGRAGMIRSHLPVVKLSFDWPRSAREGGAFRLLGPPLGQVHHFFSSLPPVTPVVTLSDPGTACSRWGR